MSILSLKINLGELRIEIEELRTRC